MARAVCDPDASELLKFKTLVLKVLIHCEGCRKKVKKVVQSIEGVYRTEVDPLQHKVVVTGSIDAEIVIKQLLKNGKQAQIWPEPNIKTTTTTNIDDKSDTNQEKKKTSVSSGKSEKNAEKKQENPPGNEAHKKIPAGKNDQDYDSTAKHSKNKNLSPSTNPAEKMPLENTIPANKLDLVKPTERVGGGGSGNRSSEAKKKPDKKAGNCEGRTNNDPPPLMMAGHYPPSSINNAVTPSDNLIQPAYQPIIPAPAYTEAMSYNASSHSSSTNVGSALFYAPPSLHHSDAYFGPLANGYNLSPPPDPIIANFSDHNDYYYDEDDEIGCSIM